MATTQNEVLQSTTAAVAGPQSVSMTQGNATNSVQAYSTTSTIWFSFGIGSGSGSLNVNFNGQTYYNVQPGSYQVPLNSGTPLNLDLTVNGSAKLTWASA
jgi:hypothetical protein